MSSAAHSGTQFVGRVVSNRMQKTVVVAVERLVWQPKLKLYAKRTSKHLAHDEAQGCDIGDIIKIAWTKRLSKHKSYVVDAVLRKADVYSAERGAAAAAARDAADPSRDAVAVAQRRLEEARARLERMRLMYERELAGEGEAGGGVALGVERPPAAASAQPT